MDNKRAVGTAYEDRAAEFLKENGLTILERNYRNRRGEIDIVARDGIYLVFCEVKYRKNAAYGYPAEAVTPHKQHIITEVAKYYLLTHQQMNSYVRFDVIAILGDSIDWIRNAF